jgi:polyribonucleotide nucleotidyltransferase
MKPQPIRKSIDLGDGKIITLETGVLAKQAHGSVVLSIGKTMILATVVSNTDARDGVDFLPLSVDYQEKFASVGRIPGSFLRREGRPSDYEVLVCRIVDRALRPLFPDDYHSDVQVLITLMSSDDEVMPDALAGLAGSAAIILSDIPFNGPLAEVRVGRINGKLVINPGRTELADADLDIIVGGTAKDINMVEGDMMGVSELDMVDALKFAHEHIKTLCQMQLDLAELAGGRKAPREYSHEVNDLELKAKVKADLYDKLYAVAVRDTTKNERADAFEAIKTEYIESFGEELEAEKAGLIKKYFKSALKSAVRNMMLETRKRLDGRALDEVRFIWSEVDYLPSAHGSAVFTRGETQSITTVTLGSKLDSQLLDSPNLSGYGKFMLHYNFPPFSTGEARPQRGVGRREVGHGNLAKRGLEKMLPDDVPYTVRVVSDILESNGSSSMATVCAGSLALMDAGIKMKSGVSGIAMGMISDEETGKYAILSDILGDEDHLGDMDFKVIGNRDGILACQMDIKVNGLSYDVLAEALLQAKAGRLHILDEMEKTLSAPKEDYKEHTPRIIKFAIEKDKIGGVIGTGGKVIQELQARTNTTISIEEVDGKGIIEIMSADRDGMLEAKAYIDGICADAEEGATYEGVVKGIQDFGAFVEFLPGKQGLLHISEIDYKRIDSMEGIYKEGDKVTVKLVEVDKRSGKYRLSRKALLEKPEGYVEPEKRERSERPSGDRRDSRGGGGDRRGGRDNRSSDRNR